MRAPACLLVLTLISACAHAAQTQGPAPARVAAAKPAAAKRHFCPCHVNAVLDAFHAAAARADEEAYFAQFAADGVFLGTDPGERWDVPAFRAFVHPYFSQGKGWAYRPRERKVSYSEDGRVAWFDELLDNDKYGELRGSGVLVKEGEIYKIAQYNLTFVIPNDLSLKYLELKKASTPTVP